MACCRGPASPKQYHTHPKLDFIVTWPDGTRLVCHSYEEAWDAQIQMPGGTMKAVDR